MRPHNTIHRSLTSMTVGLQQRMRQNQDLKRLWGFSEREQQFQFPFNGTIGLVPVETTFKILFDHIFAGDPGYARDSQLGEPIARFGFRIDTAPAGTVPYAHVSSWIQDDDKNFIGANVLVGAHNPAVLDTQATYTQPFAGLIHCTFQGYGATIDNPGDILAGADGASGGGPRGVDALPILAGGGDDLGGGNGSTATRTGTGTGVTSSGGGGGAGGGAGVGSGGGLSASGGGSGGAAGSHAGSGSGGRVDPVTAALRKFSASWNKNLHMPKYPSGPLGGFDKWTQVAQWNAGGNLSHWDIPDQEAPLKVDENDGRLTASSAYDVYIGSIMGGGSYPKESRWWTNFISSDFYWVGDKYAARWTDPGRTADGHKIRLHYLMNLAGNGDQYTIFSAVLNMKDRTRGLAFWWGYDCGIGWETDLRKLGIGGGAPWRNVSPGPYRNRNTFNQVPDDPLLVLSCDNEFNVPRDARNPYMVNAPPSFTGLRALEDIYDEANPPLDRYTPEQDYALRSLGLDMPKEAWVEIWRDGLTIHAAIYRDAPGNGATPAYMSDYRLRPDDPNFGPNVGGYFGWTFSFVIDGINSGPDPYGGAGHNWPFDMPIRGIADATLFKRTS